MTATTQPIKPVKPLSAGDFLAPGARAVPVRDFAAEMRPFQSQEIVGPHGQHVLRSAETPTAPLNAFDRIPGVHAKGGLRPAAPLSAADRVPGARAIAKDQNVESQARKWVSQTFFGTLLKQMHDSPFKSELFSGGRGGKAFEPLMDQHLADHMARGSGKKLVRVIAKQLKRKAAKAYEAQEKPGAAKNPFNDLNGGAAGDRDAPPDRGQPGAKPRAAAPNPYPNTRGYVPTGIRG